MAEQQHQAHLQQALEHQQAQVLHQHQVGAQHQQHQQLQAALVAVQALEQERLTLHRQQTQMDKK